MADVCISPKDRSAFLRLSLLSLFAHILHFEMQTVEESRNKSRKKNNISSTMAGQRQKDTGPAHPAVIYGPKNDRSRAANKFACGLGPKKGQ